MAPAVRPGVNAFDRGVNAFDRRVGEHRRAVAVRLEVNPHVEPFRLRVQKLNPRVGARDVDAEDDFIDDDAQAAAAVAEAHGHGHEKNQGWGRGIRSDFRRTVRKHWLSELTNLNTKTIAVSFFLFIAVIAPSITFGAVYAKRTNNYIGASELLLGTAWCGIFYSLVSGQVRHLYILVRIA